MNWIKRLFGISEQRAITYATGQSSGLLDVPTRTGLQVTELTALGCSAVWCATRVISEAIGSLPLVTYRKTDEGGRERAEDHPLYSILHDSPNPEMTRPIFFEVLMSHALLWGNAYAEIERDNAGNPIALWPINPQFVQVLRDTDTGELLYRINQPNTFVQDPTLPYGTILRQEDVISVMGLSPDGSAGYSLLRIARENIGYTQACDKFGQSFFGNMARLGGMLSSPNKVSPEAAENLRKSFQLIHGGTENVGSTGLLEEGMTYQPFTFSNEAGLYTETRQFQIEEVARMFNISPVKLHSLGRATWNNLSVLNTDFYVTTLRPWLEKFECEMERKLGLLNSDVYVEFLADSILRGDTTTRYAAYSTALAAGFLEVDEVRAFENLPPLAEDIADDQTDDQQPQPNEAEAIPAETPAQNLALNGAQMASLQSIAQAVADGQLPEATGVALVMVSIPTLNEAQAKAIISPAANFKPEAEPTPQPVAAPPETKPTDEPQSEDDGKQTD